LSVRSTLISEPAPDFTDPLGLLAACHRRMLGFCGLLGRMPAHLAMYGIDEEATDAALRVMHYFDTAAVLHHLDEERDLFPLLARQTALAPLIDRLQAQHRELECQWQTLVWQLRQIPGGTLEAAAFREAAERYGGTCREHIDREETQLLPAARACLDSRQLRALGHAMAVRRGQTGVDPKE
jgi:hemerythrin-like domain-containing protein